MSDVTPDKVMAQVAALVPSEVQARVIVIGSVAVGYHFFGGDREREVRTKDIDCLLAPRRDAVESGRAVATALLREGWVHRRTGSFGVPQPTPTPENALSAIRLRPPEVEGWFVELLTVPTSEDEQGKSWIPVQLDDGYYGLPTFEFLSLAALDPIPTVHGIRYARPSMMALANLLAHPRIAADTMSSKFAGREIKRSNKDLGRVLGIALLTGPDGVEDWVDEWGAAVMRAFPTRWRNLAQVAGDGLRELLKNPNDLEEALITLNDGILVGRPQKLEEIRVAGERLLQDAVVPLAAAAD